MLYKIVLFILASLENLQAQSKPSLEALLTTAESQNTKEVVRSQTEVLYNSSILLRKESSSVAREFIKKLPNPDSEKGKEIFLSDTGLKGSRCSKNMCRSSSISLIKKNPSLLIFVSFSLSDSTLKQLYKDAQKIGARLIMRGFYQNSFSKSQQKIQSLGIEVDIDPLLFQKFHIEHMPSFVLLESDVLSPESSESQAFDVVKGNVTLKYVLEKFAEEGSEKSRAMARQLMVEGTL